MNKKYNFYGLTLFILTIIFWSCGRNQNINTTIDSGLIDAESFEGIMIYDLIYTRESGFYSTENSKYFMGTEVSYHYKNEKFISISNGTHPLKRYYPGKDSSYNYFPTENIFIASSVRENENKILD